jgi:hypothetical protein
MSTRINVTVDSGGLLDRNTQQTAANRQARLLQDGRAKAETTGTAQRRARFAAEGRDPQGRPITTPTPASGFGSRINRYTPDPAANRRKLPDELIVYWTATGPAATTGNVTWTTIDLGSGYATTTFQGQLAARAIPGDTFVGPSAGLLHIGEVDESVFSLNTQNFTLEVWANVGSSRVNESTQVEIFSDSAFFNFIQEAESDSFDGQDYQVISLASTFGLDAGLLTYQESTDIAPGWLHHCFQVRGTEVIYHQGGVRKFSEDEPTLIGIDMTGNLVITALPSAASGTSTAIGQIRITKGSARYGTSNFTPPTRPFFIAPV